MYNINYDIHDLPGEIWKPIVDYPDYEISNKGRVKSFKRENACLLSQHMNNDGYLRVALCKDG